MVTSGPLRLERQNETGNDAKHRPLSVAVEMPTAADTARHCPPIGQNRCWCICAYLFLSAQRPALYLHLHLHPAFCQHPKGPKNQKAKKPKLLFRRAQIGGHTKTVQPRRSPSWPTIRFCSCRPKGYGHLVSGERFRMDTGGRTGQSQARRLLLWPISKLDSTFLPTVSSMSSAGSASRHGS